jgi:transketolase
MNLLRAKKNIIKVANLKNKGHIPSAFSIIDIIYSFYERELYHENEFILSKGHGCLALYSVFLEKNFITEDEFFSFSDLNSILGGHPDMTKHIQIKASTGSLGHGLPIAVGKALSYNLKSLKNKVFCLLGDGECNEGSIWEAAILANNLNLNNLICLIDFNQSQFRSQSILNLDKKFESFGWNVKTVDGHNHEMIYNSFVKTDGFNLQKPTCIIFNTIKGKGIKEMEEDIFSWHHRGISNNDLNNFLNQLEHEATISNNM